MEHTEHAKTAVDAVSQLADLTPLAKALIVGFGVFGPALGIGLIFSKGLEGISRNPEAAGKITPWLLIGAGMVELFGLASIGLFFLI
ncbi:F0F1 ATP synthase subunit C [Candidatus Campbellbacteria bacterium]|nr:MAG: F0F1 ATP synthase subunit C [Candidatus Campbellbacteria bacterium]